MKRIILLIAGVILFQWSVWGTPITRTYGVATNNESGYTIKTTTDGGYIICGSTEEYGDSESELYVIKIDNTGATQWTRTYGGTNAEDAGIDAIYPTSDNGYIICGTTHSFGKNGDVYIIKIDNTGATQWTRTYGGTNEDTGQAVVETSDGGYIVTGVYDNTGPNPPKVYLLKLNNTGMTQWTKTYGGITGRNGYNVRETDDSGFIVVGYIVNPTSSDVYLMKTDNTGATQWTRTYGDTNTDVGFNVEKTSDNGYILAGFSEQPSGGGINDIYVIKVDNNGNKEWEKRYGGTDDDWGFSIKNVNTNGYLVCGRTRSYGAGEEDVYVVRIDNTGATQWTRTYGGYTNDSGYSLVVRSDGTYAVVGETYSFGSGGKDVYLIIDSLPEESTTNTNTGEPANSLDNATTGATVVNVGEGEEVEFLNLTANAKVDIYTSAGELVVSLNDDNNDGIIRWDGKNSDGELITNGVYLCKITNTKGESKILKVVIVVK